MPPAMPVCASRNWLVAMLLPAFEPKRQRSAHGFSSRHQRAGIHRGLSWHFELPHLELHSVVGVAGFEPTASSSLTKRATRLRHTPKYWAKQTSPPREGGAAFFPNSARAASEFSGASNDGINRLSRPGSVAGLPDRPRSGDRRRRARRGRARLPDPPPPRPSGPARDRPPRKSPRPPTP